MQPFSIITLVCWGSLTHCMHRFESLCETVWFGVVEDYLFFPIHKDAAGWKVLKEKLGVKCLLVVDKCLPNAAYTSSADVGKAEDRSQSGTSVEQYSVPPVSPLPAHFAHLSCATLSPSCLTITNFFSKEAELRGEALRVLHVHIIRTTLGSKHSSPFIGSESVRLLLESHPIASEF